MYKNTSEQSTRIPLWIACEETGLALSMIMIILLSLLYKKKSLVAGSARRQDKLLEYSDAVRPQKKKGFK